MKRQYHTVAFDKPEMEKMAEAFGVKIYPPFRTPFTAEQADGAWPNNTTVWKCNSEPDDTHKNGERGIVLGSMSIPFTSNFFYFVSWDNDPYTPIGVADLKLSTIPPG